MAFIDEMDKKIGARPILKVELIIGVNTYNITSYYKGGANYNLEKENIIDKLTTSSVTYTFSNHNNYFTDTYISSVFYNVIYINKAKIKFSVGYIINGIAEYETQSTMIITRIKCNNNNSTINIHCEDRFSNLISSQINIYPLSMIAIPNTNNIGNGKISEIQSKPFHTINENFTVTITSISDNTYFSVVGSISGNNGTGIVGEQFISNGEQVKFTLSQGTINLSVGDSFTFSTFQHPEYDNINPVKIIWNILTGYDWDTEIASNWETRTLQYDHTKSSSNIDIDYNSFIDVMAKVEAKGILISGAIKYNKSSSELLEELMSMFFGAIWINKDGKIQINYYYPSLDETLREFSYNKKITKFEYEKDFKNMINSVTAYYKTTKTWAWSGDMEKDNFDLLDGIYIKKSTINITNYGIEKNIIIKSYWYSDDGIHIIDNVNRIVDIYAIPPIIISLITGLDALQISLSNRIKITENKIGYNQQICETIGIKKSFNSHPFKISLIAIDDNTTNFKWAFLGSNINEVDHDWTNPDSQNYDTATDWEKKFCYLSSDGSEVQPLYYLY